MVEFKDLVVNPKFKDAIFPLTTEARNGLKASLRKGWNERLGSIIVREGTNEILAGHNRREIIIELAEEGIIIEPTIGEEKAETEEEALAWIYSDQVSRRNSTPDDIKYYIGMEFNMLKKPKGGRQEAKPEGTVSKSTAEIIAEKYNIDHSTVDEYAKYADDVNKVAKYTKQSPQDVLKVVIEQKVPMSYLKIVAGLKADEQREVFEKFQNRDKKTKLKDILKEYQPAKEPKKPKKQETTGDKPVQVEVTGDDIPIDLDELEEELEPEIPESKSQEIPSIIILSEPQKTIPVEKPLVNDLGIPIAVSEPVLMQVIECFMLTYNIPLDVWNTFVVENFPDIPGLVIAPIIVPEKPQDKPEIKSETQEPVKVEKPFVNPLNEKPLIAEKQDSPENPHKKPKGKGKDITSEKPEKPVVEAKKEKPAAKEKPKEEPTNTNEKRNYKQYRDQVIALLKEGKKSHIELVVAVGLNPNDPHDKKGIKDILTRTKGIKPDKEGKYYYEEPIPELNLDSIIKQMAKEGMSVTDLSDLIHTVMPDVLVESIIESLENTGKVTKKTVGNDVLYYPAEAIA